MNDSVVIPEDSILRRHYQQMQAAGRAGEPEDSILRRHYRQMQQAASAATSEATSKAPAPMEEETLEVATKPMPAQATPTAAAAAAPAPAKPSAAPAREPDQTPVFADSKEPSGGFLSRLFRKLFGG